MAEKVNMPSQKKEKKKKRKKKLPSDFAGWALVGSRNESKDSGCSKQ